MPGVFKAEGLGYNVFIWRGRVTAYSTDRKRQI